MTETPTTVAPQPPRRPLLTVRDVRDIYVTLTRIDTKLDTLQVITRRLDGVEKTLADHETRIVKVESFQGFIIWIVNGGWVVLAGLAYLLAKLGVL